MNLQKAKMKYYSSIPLLGCVLDTFLLLLSSPNDGSDFNDENSTFEDGHKGTCRVETTNLVAAQRHFQQLQHIKIP